MACQSLTNLYRGTGLQEKQQSLDSILLIIQDLEQKKVLAQASRYLSVGAQIITHELGSWQAALFLACKDQLKARIHKGLN